MVRVVRHKKPGRNTAQTRRLLDLLARYIVDHPARIINLLNTYGIKTKKSSNGKVITNHVFIAIEKKGKSFHRDLARLLEQKALEETQEDSFAAALAGTIGSVANLFGEKGRRKTAQVQARSQTLQTMLAYKAQKEQQEAAIEMAREAATRSQANQERLLKMAGTTVAIAIAGWFFLKQLGKPKMAYQPNYQVTQSS